MASTLAGPGLCPLLPGSVRAHGHGAELLVAGHLERIHVAQLLVVRAGPAVLLREAVHVLERAGEGDAHEVVVARLAVDPGVQVRALEALVVVVHVRILHEVVLAHGTLATQHVDAALVPVVDVQQPRLKQPFGAKVHALGSLLQAQHAVRPEQPVLRALRRHLGVVDAERRRHHHHVGLDADGGGDLPVLGQQDLEAVHVLLHAAVQIHLARQHLVQPLARHPAVVLAPLALVALAAQHLVHGVCRASVGAYTRTHRSSRSPGCTA